MISKEFNFAQLHTEDKTRRVRARARVGVFAVTYSSSSICHAHAAFFPELPPNYPPEPHAQEAEVLGFWQGGEKSPQSPQMAVDTVRYARSPTPITKIPLS